jgi:hypothetical protein
MKEYDSICWIGGEGIPYRYHIVQGEEREEAVEGGFQLTEARGKCNTVRKLSYSFFSCTHTHRTRHEK